MPMFEGTLDDQNRMRSIATNTVPSGSLTYRDEEDYSIANGSGWYTTLWADELLMWLLFPLLFKSTNSQGTLGYGYSPTRSSSNGLINNDTLLNKGLMYGTSSSSSKGMIYLGLHNWWGNRNRRAGGIQIQQGKVYVKMTPSTVDGSSYDNKFDINITAYKDTGYVSSRGESDTFISSMTPIGKYGIIPEGIDGTSSTYYCDKCISFDSGTTIWMFMFGGRQAYSSGVSGEAGIYWVRFTVAGAGDSRYGASISYHPNALE